MSDLYVDNIEKPEQDFFDVPNYGLFEEQDQADPEDVAPVLNIGHKEAEE